MFFVYDITNYNPTMGVAKNGKQAVSVYDRDLGNRRVVETTPEEADAFVSARKQSLENASKEGLLSWLAAAVLGTGAGAGIGAYMQNSKSKKINELVDKINPEYEKIYEKNGKMKLSAESEALKGDAYKKYVSELRSLFSEEKNMFTKIDVSKAAKSGAKYGAGFGLALGAVLGMFFPLFMVENADKKITKAFIDNNKFEKTEVPKEVIENDDEQEAQAPVVEKIEEIETENSIAEEQNNLVEEEDNEMKDSVLDKDTEQEDE